MHNRALLGKRGEDAAVRYLESLEFTIVARNYRCREGELDMVATRGRELHFVEVKTRSNLQFDRPAASVNYRKQQKIRHTAVRFLHEFPQYVGWALSFDVVELLVDGDRAHVNFLQACF